MRAVNDSAATQAIDEFDGEMISGGRAQHGVGQNAHPGPKQTDESEADNVADGARHKVQNIRRFPSSQ
jgi:hypothetical protein